MTLTPLQHPSGVFHGADNEIKKHLFYLIVRPSLWARGPSASWAFPCSRVFVQLKALSGTQEELVRTE